jgi:hypothetical protein
MEAGVVRQRAGGGVVRGGKDLMHLTEVIKMKSRLRISGGKSMKAFLTYAVVFCFLGVIFLTPTSYAGYSNGPRQTGEEVLDEILMGPAQFIVRVASNGGTDKSSFKIDVKKEAGLSVKTPHYTITIIRIKPDECKAIVDDGTLILFDLEKDLGTGDFTYSITNRVFSSSKSPSSAESLFSIIEKYFTLDFPAVKEIKPEPFDKFVMDHDYFTCYLPANWKLERDREGDEKAGIFEINLTMPEKAKPEDGEKYFFPDPLIYVGYYSNDPQQNQTYESYLKDYEELALKREGSEKSRYEKRKPIKFNEKEASEITYEVYQEKPRGPLVTTKYWLKAKFIVIKAKEGFYVLAYKSPQEFYDQYLPAFEETVATFQSSLL